MQMHQLEVYKYILFYYNHNFHFFLDTRSRQSVRLTTSADFTDDEFPPENIYVSLILSFFLQIELVS
jgi:hypothetical protein